jgi:hypothetical protein
VRVGKARAVVVAPNIEPAEGEAGLSSLLGGILGDASARGIPVVFALSRKRMGQVGLWPGSCQGAADAIMCAERETLMSGSVRHLAGGLEGDAIHKKHVDQLHPLAGVDGVAMRAQA